MRLGLGLGLGVGAWGLGLGAGVRVRVRMGRGVAQCGEAQCGVWRSAGCGAVRGEAHEWPRAIEQRGGAPLELIEHTTHGTMRLGLLLRGRGRARPRGRGRSGVG